jgi:hypothetical protein
MLKVDAVCASVTLVSTYKSTWYNNCSKNKKIFFNPTLALYEQITRNFLVVW